MPMSQNTLPVDTSLENEEVLACEVCMTCVPVSEADSVEAGEYVAYFFGLECYEQWMSQKEDPPKS